jgi:hypothetical protein
MDNFHFPPAGLVSSQIDSILGNRASKINPFRRPSLLTFHGFLSASYRAAQLLQTLPSVRFQNQEKSFFISSMMGEEKS